MVQSLSHLFSHSTTSTHPDTHSNTHLLALSLLLRLTRVSLGSNGPFGFGFVLGSAFFRSFWVYWCVRVCGCGCVGVGVRVRVCECEGVGEGCMVMIG